MTVPEAADCVRFQPSRVAGLPQVTEAVVWPDRIQFLSAGRTVSFRYSEMGKRLWPSPFWSAVSRLGWKRPPVIGEGHWFGDPRERRFEFYLEPKLCVYMPSNEVHVSYPKSTFARVQTLIRLAGYAIVDGNDERRAS